MSSNTHTKPLVSIMMTTYNRADFIREAIESVLVQTYHDWELLILDDGSTDSTREVVEEYMRHDARIKYLPALQNMGITRNRNRGFAYASGEYTAVLDSDDVWCDTTKLEKQVSYMKNNPECVVVGTFSKIIDEHGKGTGAITYPTSDSAIRQSILRRNPFTHSGVLMRAEAVIQAGTYDETVPIWEDYDLFLRLGQTGSFANIPEVLASYRQHSGNISKEKKLRGAQTHLAIIKKYKVKYPHYFPALLKAYTRILLSMW